MSGKKKSEQLQIHQNNARSHGTIKKRKTSLQAQHISKIVPWHTSDQPVKWLKSAVRFSNWPALPAHSIWYLIKKFQYRGLYALFSLPPAGLECSTTCTFCLHAFRTKSQPTWSKNHLCLNVYHQSREFREPGTSHVLFELTERYRILL